MLFDRHIHSWASWEKARADLAAFHPLLQYIYRKNGLEWEEPHPLPLGSSALYQIGDTVLKLYPLEEAGASPMRDMQTETAMLRHLAGTPLRTPKLLHHGAVQDEVHLFYYSILSFVDGEAAGRILRVLDRSSQLTVAKRLRKLTARLHALPHPDVLMPEAAYDRTLASPHWASFPVRFRWQASERAMSLRSLPQVLTHGELNGMNLLFDRMGELTMLDFTEAAIAPAVYEWPSILLDLFGGDLGLAKVYTGEDDPTRIAGGLLDGIALHGYGASYARSLLRSIGLRDDQAQDFSLLEEAILRGWARDS